MMDYLSLIFIVVFFTAILFVNRKNLGVASFDEYATSNGAFGFVSITMAVLVTWYVGSSFTALATQGVLGGVSMIFVVPYATFCIVVMNLVSQRTWTWGKLHGLVTQADLVGYRYDSKGFQALVGIATIACMAPWLMLEWVVQGYVLSYATGGMLPTSVGMIVGAVVVLVYVTLGGMKGVITANLLQGILMIFGGIILIYWIINHFWGGVGAGYEMLYEAKPEFLSWTASEAAWTSMVVSCSIGAWMWPSGFNKTFSASSVRELKRSCLLAPILGATFWMSLTFLANMSSMNEYILAHPAEVFVRIAQEAGPLPLAIMSVIIMACSVGTVSGFLHACSTSFARDVAPLFNKELSNDKALNYARRFIMTLSIICIIWAISSGEESSQIGFVLSTYQVIIQVFPMIVLGLFWRKTSKYGALTGFVVSASLAMYWNFYPPAFVFTTGWSGGMLAILINIGLTVGISLFNKNTERADIMFTEFAVIKEQAKRKYGKVSSM